ncbi:MAG: EAL domain-containing protein [Sulfuricurvum sp.]
MYFKLLNIKHWLLLLSVVPLLVLIALSMIIISNKLEHKKALLHSQEKVIELNLMGEVVHALQLERALSVGFLASTPPQDTDNQLDLIRDEVDERLLTLGKHSRHTPAIAQLVAELKGILPFREKIDAKVVDDELIKSYYTSKVKLFLALFLEFQKSLRDRDEISLLQSYWHLATAKDALGLLRATLSKVFIDAELSPVSRYWLVVNQEKYNENISSFLSLADERIERKYGEIFKDQSVKKTFNIISEAIKYRADRILLHDPQEWIEISSTTLDHLHAIEAEFCNLFNLFVEEKLDEINRELMIISVLLLVSVITIILLVSVASRRVFKLASDLEQKFSSTKLLLEQYKSSVDGSSIVSKTDPKGRITYVNDEFCKISGYARGELLGKPHNIVRHPDMPREVFKDMWYHIKDLKEPWSGEVKNRNKDGSSYWVRAYVVPILGKDGEIVEYIGLRTEITELVEQREKLQKIAFEDHLTHFYNRLKLNQDIAEASEELSLAIVNIDGFRELNDFYGHGVGDEIILKCAKKMDEYIKSDGDFRLYRLQGDEFVVLGSKKSETVFTNKIITILYHLRSSEIFIEDEHINISCSAGISFESNETLLSSANMALKVAKLDSKDLVIYNRDNYLNQQYKNNIKYNKILSNALRDDRVVLYYQAIVENASKECSKYEALVRIVDEDGSIISPYFFLDVAKKSKKYIRLSRTILKKALSTLADSPCELSINLSIKDMMEPSMLRYITELLERYSVGHRVTFEIVESEYIGSFDEALLFINELKRYGCKIAIDDFGTGYSNFEYLIKLKADYLKIDGSLIKNITRDKVSYQVVSTIVDFGHKLGMKIVAEFVEDEEIYKAVCDLGIECSQGYYFHKPDPRLASYDKI